MDPGNLSIDSALSTIVIRQTNVIWTPATKYVAVCIGTTADLNRSTPASKKPRKPANFRYTSGLDKTRHRSAIYRSYENAARSKGVISFGCYFSLKAEAFYAALGFGVSGRSVSTSDPTSCNGHFDVPPRNK